MTHTALIKTSVQQSPKGITADGSFSYMVLTDSSNVTEQRNMARKEEA